METGTYKPITGLASPNYVRKEGPRNPPSIRRPGRPVVNGTWLGRSNDKTYPKEEKEPCECGVMVGVSKWSKKQHQQTAVHARMMMDVIEQKYLPYDQRYKTQPQGYEAQKARQVVKVTCECGCEVSRGNLNAHKRSARHSHMMAEQLTEKYKKNKSYFVPSVGKWRRINPGYDASKWMKDPDLKGKCSVQVSTKHHGLDCWVGLRNDGGVGVVPVWPGIKRGKSYWDHCAFRDRGEVWFGDTKWAHL